MGLGTRSLLEPRMRRDRHEENTSYSRTHKAIIRMMNLLISFWIFNFVSLFRRQCSIKNVQPFFIHHTHSNLKNEAISNQRSANRKNQNGISYFIYFILLNYFIIATSQEFQIERNHSFSRLCHFQMQALAHSLVFITLGCGTVSTKTEKSKQTKNNLYFHAVRVQR